MWEKKNQPTTKKPESLFEMILHCSLLFRLYFPSDFQSYFNMLYSQVHVSCYAIAVS